MNNFLINKSESKKEKNRVLKEARSILNHNFEILSKKIHFGKYINWQTNFAGKSWPMDHYLKFRNNYYDFDSKKYLGDLKLPWELNKHLYLQDLAKAYLLTKNEKYTQEFIAEIEDWLEQNPDEMGVNWAEGLVASHRAISWIIALSGFSQSPKISDEFLEKICHSLYQHALFIEKTYEFCARGGNHLLGELCAQIVLSVNFPKFSGSRKRLDEATKNLEKELSLQVCHDGVDYEQSLSYQRVILEFLYLPLILAKRGRVNLPKSIWQVAEKMTEFMMHMTQPSGLLQPISDADGARVFVLGSDINDFRPHLAIAAGLFNRPDFKYVSENKIDPIVWFLSPEELEDFNKIKPTPSQEKSVAFREGGYWISRQNWSKDSAWLFFDCGNIGMGPWSSDFPVGVHGHSDTLNFGLAIGGETFLTDNGSYAYTRERPFHLYFRRSLAHNVAMVDRQDQNIVTDKPWLMRQFCLPRQAKHYFTDEIDYLSGAHTGYLRLTSAILTKREILYFKKKGFLILKDSFIGKGSHEIWENFHFYPGLKISKIGQSYKVKGKKNILYIKPFFETKSTIVSGQSQPVIGWYAPTYGQKYPSKVVRFNHQIEGDTSCYFVFSFKNQNILEQDLEAVKRLFETTFKKLRKPKIAMLISNNLQNDPRVQKEASVAAKISFDVTVLAHTPEKNQSDFRSQEYEVTHLIYRQPNLRKDLSKLIAHNLIKIYYRSQFLHRLLSYISSKNLFRLKIMGFVDLNQPIILGQKPVKDSSSRKNRNIFSFIFVSCHYFYRLNKQLIEAGIKIEPDIVHANDLDTLWAGYQIKKKTGAKLVYDAHEFWQDMGLKVPKVYLGAFKLLEKYLLKKIDGFVTVNEPILAKTKDFYRHEFKIPTIVVYNCPNYEKITLSKSRDKKIQILYQGRYADGRGLEQLVESAKFLPRNVEIAFRAIKDEVIEERLQKIANKYNLGPKIKFLPPVSMTEMVKAAKTADIGVIPYLPIHIDNELCSPNKLFEYMMAGLALACSDLPVLRSFVKEYQNGVLFNPNDPKSIAHALNKLIKNRILLKQMKKNSLEAAKELNWENQAKKLIGLYNLLLSGKKENG